MSDHVKTLYKGIETTPIHFETWFATIKPSVIRNKIVEGKEISTFLTDKQFEYIDVVSESVRKTLCTTVDANNVSQISQILPERVLLGSQRLVELKNMISVGTIWQEKKGLGFC